MALVPWTGIALAAYGATEGCYANATPPCMAAGTGCGNGGTALAGSTHQQLSQVTSGGNVSYSVGAAFDCKYYCMPGGYLTQTQTQSTPTGGTC